MVQHYELMVAFPGTLEEAAIKTAKDQLCTTITANGTITSQYDMQQRRLAYRIKQQSFAFYHVMQFDMEANKVRELDHKLRLDQGILRYLIVRTKPQTEEQLRAMLEVKAKPVEETSSVKVSAIDTGFHQLETTVPVEPKAEPLAVKTEKEAVSMEELDKKLDAILEDSDIESKL